MNLFKFNEITDFYETLEVRINLLHHLLYLYMAKAYDQSNFIHTADTAVLKVVLN